MLCTCKNTLKHNLYIYLKQINFNYNLVIKISNFKYDISKNDFKSWTNGLESST